MEGPGSVSRYGVVDGETCYETSQDARRCGWLACAGRGDTRVYRGAYHIRFSRLECLGSLLELALSPLGLSHLLTTRALAVVHLRFSDRPKRKIE
jgi:hypothetical protein|tara:strand:- start:5395 stop:5679 length:285 start_codon:yes stop_codon:yes gene_type:complete